MAGVQRNGARAGLGAVVGQPLLGAGRVGHVLLVEHLQGGLVAGQFGQALIVQRTSRQSIALRFENLQLVGRLQQARIKAEEANQAKSKFLAAASHDLRQPVHAQELFLEVLASSDLSEVQHKVLGNARAASQAAAQMLNILLDFSRIEAGVIEPQHCTFQLQPLLHKLEIELGGQADAKGIVYRSRETALAVDSDPALLELMLRNLITNAIRYTERGGVLIGCRQRGDHVSIEVVDTGIGIAAAHQTEIFREFHQLGNPERDRTKGLGLGLAITDGLARSLNHAMSLVSEPGRGSIFRIRVPLAKRCTREYAFNSLEIQPSYGTRLQGLCVLVIEDDAIVRQAMEHLLSDWGCDCRTEESMDDAALQRLNRSGGIDALPHDQVLALRQRVAELAARLTPETTPVSAEAGHGKASA